MKKNNACPVDIVQRIPQKMVSMLNILLRYHLLLSLNSFPWYVVIERETTQTVFEHITCFHSFQHIYLFEYNIHVI